MGIGHLYWYALSFLLCGLYSHSHFEGWPNKGWGPHKGFSNRYRDDPDVKSKAAAQKAAADADKLAEEVAGIIRDYEKKADKVDRKARHARARSRRRGESEDEREIVDVGSSASLDGMSGDSRRLLKGQRMRRLSGLEKARRRGNESESAARGGETTRKRKRSVSGEQAEGGENGGEQRDDSHPRKRVGRPRLEGGDPQPDETEFDAKRRAGESQAKQEDGQSRVQITLDSNGMPRLSTASPSHDALQDALLLSAGLLPPRPTFANANDHEFETPIPTSVREELLSTTKGSTQTGRKAFSLLMAFCRNNDLLLTLISHLPIPSIISLYAVSKTFHYLFNRHHTAFILSSMRTWAPNADTIYPWRCYKSLCTNDPILRQKMKYRGLDEEEAIFRLGRRGRDLRDVPTLRWLQMVVWREGVCKDMLVMLATKGLRCPPGTLDAVKRIWFMMDLPLNSQRIALMHNTSYMGNHTLYGMTAFLLKVDMAFTVPDQAAYPARYPGMPANWAHNIPTAVPLRKLLLAERHLTSVWRVLRGWTWDPTKPRIPMTKLEALRLWVRHKFHLPEDAPENVKGMSVMGMPWWELGTASLERTGVAFFNLDGRTVPVTHPAIMSPAACATHLGKQLLYPHRRVIHLPRVLEKPREPLLRPDELLLKEGVRRQMNMAGQWVHIMLWGFCDDVGFNWPVFSEEEYRRMDRREGNVMEVLQERQRALREKAAMEQEGMTEI